jgi:hypothetical protein
VNYVGQVIGGDLFEDPVTQVPLPLPPETYRIPQPDCGAGHNVNGNGLLAASPLEPGLWCVTGGLDIHGNDTLQVREVDGIMGVTIYMVSGGITINGNATVQIVAPGFVPDPAPALPGVLIYMAPGNNSEVQINGDADSFFTGTVYAPESNVDMLGNGEVDAYKTQVIAWNVEAGGNSDTYVVFQQQKAYVKPTSMDLNR